MALAANKRKIPALKLIPHQCDSYGIQPQENTSSIDDITKTKMELYGRELIHKEVKSCGECGRVYVPLAWVGKKVKIILVD